jgi:two-component system phosphate regulon response regulator PhoB
MKLKVLIVEDENSLLELLKFNFTKDGFKVDTAMDGETALEKILNKAPDLLVLDWMLPKLSGIELCRRIRKNKEIKNLPIIILTARGEEDDRLRGLETGADDYITKPFSVNELMARVKAVLRRIRPMFAEEVLSYKGIVVDLVSHSVNRDNETLHLGPTEFNLLVFFMENIGRVFSREQLLNHVWKDEAFVEPRTVDVHIRRLRKAINNDVKEDYIRTVRSAGYSFGS